MNNKTGILLVEDNLLVSTAVQDMLGDEGYSVGAAANGKEARAFLKDNTCQLVLLDMVLPDANGQKLLEEWQRKYPELTVVIMTAHGDIPTAVECLRAGAYDFLTKPVEKNLLLKTINNALLHNNMLRKVDTLAKIRSGEASHSDLSDIIATSPSMAGACDMLRRVADTDFSCLLITGESGTGKGLLAKNVHKTGQRHDKPFIEINCSALPENLIESELFGHKRGAFTDAKEDKIGLFEMADTGTLFLDEIGDMDIKLQAKLLKVMEEQNFRRIGGVEDIKVDVAIIAATNQNLEDHVASGKFRSDLYYRLNVIPIKLPPLRERPDDIAPLAAHFLRFFSRKFGRDIKAFSKENMEILARYDWPGNVREFRNVVERACILSRSGIIDDPAVLFPGGIAADKMSAPAGGAITEENFPAMQLADAEKMVIKAAMRDAEGNKNKAAAILGLHRTTLYKKLEEYHIE